MGHKKDILNGVAGQSDAGEDKPEMDAAGDDPFEKVAGDDSHNRKIARDSDPDNEGTRNGTLSDSIHNIATIPSSSSILYSSCPIFYSSRLLNFFVLCYKETLR